LLHILPILCALYVTQARYGLSKTEKPHLILCTDLSRLAHHCGFPSYIVQRGQYKMQERLRILVCIR